MAEGPVACSSGPQRPSKGSARSARANRIGGLAVIEQNGLPLAPIVKPGVAVLVGGLAVWVMRRPQWHQAYDGKGTVGVTSSGPTDPGD